MMNFEQVSEKISANGYRRRTGTSEMYNEEDGSTLKIYDFEHRKRQDTFSVYVNEYGSVEYIEFTKVDFNRETGKYSQEVRRIENLQSLNRYLG